MIARAILKDPEKINCLDWFNDGRDTMNWVVGRYKARVAEMQRLFEASAAMMARMDNPLLDTSLFDDVKKQMRVVMEEVETVLRNEQ